MERHRLCANAVLTSTRIEHEPALAMTSRSVLIGSLIGALALFGSLRLAGDHLGLQSARAESGPSACMDWEVQWFVPQTAAPIVVAPNRTAPDPRIVAVPSGWEPISGSFGAISGYALRRCVH